MNLKSRPIVGITMGDAAGIGPEIIAKALSRGGTYRICRPLVIGNASVIEEGIKIANVQLKVNSIENIRKAVFKCGTIDVFNLENIKIEELQMGRPQAMAGKAAVEYVQKAVELAMRREIHAIVTAPISKEAINMANYKFPGHTELLAQLTNTRDYAMMLVKGNLRVIHVTTHSPLKDVPKSIRKDKVFKTIKLAYEALKFFWEIKNPKIAVAGLNPHAGEGGLLGNEEITEITPAIELAKKMGINVVGPLSPDTVFVKALGGEFDAVVAMYHDQGHIPIKLVGFKLSKTTKRWEAVEGVNVTIGLPIIRTSVDHGTAYGKAGRKEGTANPQSLIEAIKLAAKMAKIQSLKTNKESS